MKPLREQSDKNSAEAYNEIYLKREGEADDQDLRRWKKLLKYYKGGRLIDMGCLDSQVPLIAAERFPHAEMWGIDQAELAINKMREKYPWVYYEVRDVYETNFPKNYFSYVVGGELIEHLEEPKHFIEEAMRILRPGGTLAISTPLNEAIEPGAVDGERHLWSYTQDDLIDMLKPYGYVKIKTMGSTFFPTYQYHFPTILAYCKKYGDKKTEN